MTSEFFLYTPEYLDIILDMTEIITDTVSASLGKKKEINQKKKKEKEKKIFLNEWVKERVNTRMFLSQNDAFTRWLYLFWKRLHLAS